MKILEELLAGVPLPRMVKVKQKFRASEVADIPILAREVVNAVKSAGGQPFLIPAMGSHGGVTSEGQRVRMKRIK
ncbi:hypothetical protein [Effusibacillus dendaii]|uniref:LarA-like N-terminal domain-containing protein n=1 Tax=Effusibacillus dendaii TaxID=2743772 RepID=A0A7I8DBX1_9BACL|nr:hypothetical protein [Effusibacillus dendaii]BCJ87595.1 hypothetical protein skT53_25800 [Effusibacillus dendaii]